MKYPYPRSDLTVRVSAELLENVHEMGYDLHVTVQDICTVAILMLCDNGHICPDWETIDKKLSYTPPTRSALGAAPRKRKTSGLANLFHRSTK